MSILLPHCCVNDVCEKILMRYVFFIVLLLGMMTGYTHASSIDQKTSKLPINTLSGETIRLGQYIGKKPIYLKFWATWCQPCREQMPHFQKVQKEYGERIKIIAVNLDVNDNIDSIKKIIDEFNLTMPVALDSSGELAQAFNMIGTPYHVLIDKSGNIVHKGHKASKLLDSKIELLLTNGLTDLPNIRLSDNSSEKLEIGDNSEKITALFFVATWCDWYLKNTRPAMSENCIIAQNSVNALYRKFPQYNWVGVVTRLWTGKKELDKYKEKYNISHPIDIDTSNGVFLRYGVKDFPTLILVKSGNELLRVNKFDNFGQLSEKLERYSAY